MTPGEQWLVSGKTFALAEVDPGSTAGAPGDKSKTEAALGALNETLFSLQERLWAEGTRSLLVVLQALDTGGKDGTIRKVFGNLNPQGCRVTAFKKPNANELAHDYLWRVHAAMPRRGEIGIFNRSHYEDVLVVRVHDLVPRAVWDKRYDQINAFEKMLTEEGTTIVKFFLHISKDEQKKRLQARLEDPTKHWKFNPDDLAERALWGKYQEAYQDVLNRTSTDWAPWYVIPANTKWYRNVIVARIAHHTLQALNPQIPQVNLDLAQYVVE